MVNLCVAKFEREFQQQKYAVARMVMMPLDCADINNSVQLRLQHLFEHGAPGLVGCMAPGNRTSVRAGN